MSSAIGILLLFPLLQGLTAILPDSWARTWAPKLRQWVTGLAAFEFVVAAVCLLALAVQGSPDKPFVLWESLSFQYDGVAGLMFALISFIGWITCQYSIRYLDGDVNQGRYFKWMSFTIAAVGGMVLAGDLCTFALMWCLTSFGLHHLLLHYSERPAARRAAWTKFIVSRIGDVAILTALCLYYPLVKSMQFADLASAAVDPMVATLPTFQLATIALALAVLSKSAQMPFHTWLPLTMETPTPVSALMHAGIVNAGGYLLVRVSPLLNASMTAQLLLIIVGTATACLASVIMLTQTTIKKKLAYSTISQMGFMLMQCGIGAYSAAMLHILAHSLYKAYEFLSSGSVVSRRAATQTLPVTRQNVSWYVTVLTMFSLFGFAWLLLTALGQNPLSKPGGVLLTGVLSAALTSWITQVIAFSHKPNSATIDLTFGSSLVVRAWLTAGLLLTCYALSYTLVDRLVASNLEITPTTWPAVAIVATAFAALFIFQMSIMSPSASGRLRNWQVHAANGFYIESWLRRSFRTLKS